MILVKNGHTGASDRPHVATGKGAKAFMEEVFDYGTGVPYTHEDLEVLFGKGMAARRGDGATCAACRWFDAASCELCLGPVTCAKWVECGKCCPLTRRTTLVEFERCPQFKIDLIMSQ